MCLVAVAFELVSAEKRYGSALGGRGRGSRATDRLARRPVNCKKGVSGGIKEVEGCAYLPAHAMDNVVWCNVPQHQRAHDSRIREFALLLLVQRPRREAKLPWITSIEPG